MEYIIVILALLCVVAGLLGALLPVLPGPPLSFVALILLYMCDNSDISVTALVVSGVVAAAITLLDYIAPIWLTNKKGGTKYGTGGTAVGMLLGLFFGPWGLIIGPFLGAFVGELIAGTTAKKAFGVAFMSFAAFMLTTGIKVVYSLVLLMMVVVEGWSVLWG